MEKPCTPSGWSLPPPLGGLACRHARANGGGRDRKCRYHHHVQHNRQIGLHTRKGLLHPHPALRPLRRIQAFLLSKRSTLFRRTPAGRTGHMPKDASMNSGHVESGLTAVNAYNQTTGACGGIDFWGNCWEWTSSTDVNGAYIIKGGSWDSKRDDCRSEKSDIVRDGAKGYANVGFRVVRIASK